jgi:predicted transcriptional regulator
MLEHVPVEARRVLRHVASLLLRMSGDGGVREEYPLVHEGSIEERQRVVSALLQATEPLGLFDLAEVAALPRARSEELLAALESDGLVVRARFVTGDAEWRYRWSAAWFRELESRVSQARRELEAAVEATGTREAHEADPNAPAATAFAEWIAARYRPPEDKRILVLLQCSVRRPFSSSPSHGTLRRAIALAVGHDPARQFAACPVHVVVLASRIGPVPYELEGLHPATVSGGGVKQMGEDEYARVRPVIAQRVAQYLDAHRDLYDHVLTFTDGRYAEVAEDAAALAGREIVLLPQVPGPRVTRDGLPSGRKYWDRYWIQLFLAVRDRLPSHARRLGDERLAAYGVGYCIG